MTVGLRIRDMNTGAVKLEVSDYLVSAAYMQNLQINGSGSVTIPGIDSANFIAFLVPCFAEVQYGDPNAYTFYESMNAPIYISGNTVFWTCGSGWQAGNLYTLHVVRTQ